MDSDFDSDDSIKDPNFLPGATSGSYFKLVSQSQGGGSVNKREESEPAVKKARCDEKKLIFKTEFYTEVQRIDENVTTAKCVGCSRVIRGSNDVTSNFIKHLERNHATLFEKFKTYKAGTLHGGNEQSAFDKKLLHAIVDCAWPLSIVEKKSFISLFDSTNVKIMSRQTMTKKLDEQYSLMLKKIKEDMSSAKYFCTTADIWSGNHKSFLGYTCHWLDKGFERKSAALACKRMFGVHSAENITQMITEINTAFGLNGSNIILTVTDNGSNFVKAFREYGVENTFREDEADDDLPVFENENLLPAHQKCCSHTLSLLASSDFDKILKTEQPLYIQHKMTLEKCNNLWKKCKWPKSSEIIVEHLGCSLVLPCVTRWNSLFDAVEKLLCHSQALNDLCDKLSLPHFSASDLKYLNMYSMMMKPIANALDFLQGENNVHYGFMMPTLFTLSNKLHKLTRLEELQQVHSIILKLEQRLVQRFEPYFSLHCNANVAITATVLTPRIKIKWLNVLRRVNPDVTEDHVTTKVLDTLQMFCNKYSSVLNFEKGNGSSLPTYFDFSNDDDDVETICSQVEPSKADLWAEMKSQFFSYLNSNLSNEEIWEKCGLLKEAFIYFNTPLPSSAPVERLFSFAGIVNSPRRQLLSDFALEKLTLMKANTHYI